jgi:hypothetical protein
MLLVKFMHSTKYFLILFSSKINQDHYNAASNEGTEAPGNHPRNLMVKTNDYGRYDPAPAFSKPRFKPIPH